MTGTPKQRKSDDDKVDPELLAWERSITWDHPLVKMGIWPGHLLRDFFGYGRRSFSNWCRDHQYLVVKMNRRECFHRDTVLAWFADPRNAGDLPAEENPAQLRHNRSSGK